MQNTPLAFRTHVSIFGNTNAGKSSLFNKLIGEDLMIVSDTHGTTTDPVTKAMELLPYGPIALCDTAGLGDTTLLGKTREKKTENILKRTDFAIYAADSSNFNKSAYETAKEMFSKFKIPHILVFTKSDIGNDYKAEYPDAVSVCVTDDKTIKNLKAVLLKKLGEFCKNDSDTMLGNLLPKGSLIVHVIPIDSETPKGRLILPQVQLLRDCLDCNMKSIIVKPDDLPDIISDYGKRIDLVVTDSQIFGKVSELVPKDLKLTSYSMLMANMKGDLSLLAGGVRAIKNLKDGSRILMAEACTHNSSHEDIGRVKIPNLLKKKTGKELIFDHYAHHDFPDNLSQYDLIIHCGGCMINAKSMQNRIDFAASNNVPITNYGITLAYLNGILDRAYEIFSALKKKPQSD